MVPFWAGSWPSDVILMTFFCHIAPNLYLHYTDGATWRRRHDLLHQPGVRDLVLEIFGGLILYECKLQSKTTCTLRNAWRLSVIKRQFRHSDYVQHNVFAYVDTVSPRGQWCHISRRRWRWSYNDKDNTWVIEGQMESIFPNERRNLDTCDICLFLYIIYDQGHPVQQVWCTSSDRQNWLTSTCNALLKWVHL